MWLCTPRERVTTSPGVDTSGTLRRRIRRERFFISIVPSILQSRNFVAHTMTASIGKRSDENTRVCVHAGNSSETPRRGQQMNEWNREKSRKMVTRARVDHTPLSPRRLSPLVLCTARGILPVSPRWTISVRCCKDDSAGQAEASRGAPRVRVLTCPFCSETEQREDVTFFYFFLTFFSRRDEQRQ